MEGTKGKKRAAENSSLGRKTKQQKIETIKGKKAPKEKSAVKRASSAYIHFSNDFRTKLKAKNEKNGEPIPKVNEIAKLAGAEWKKMTPEQKQPYEELARKDKERYEAETGKSSGAKQDSDKPKRNATAYFLFLSDFRKQMANEPLPEGQKIPTLAGEKWRSMSDKEKEPYLKQEAKGKAKYEEAMKEYRKKVPKDPPKAEKKSKPKKKPEPEPEEDDDDDEGEEESEGEEEEESDDDYESDDE